MPCHSELLLVHEESLRSNYPTNLLRGNVSANPTETSCVTIAVQSSDALTSTVVVAYVEISFIAQFTELRDIGGS